jgi:hypothetical protein
MRERGAAPDVFCPLRARAGGESRKVWLLVFVWRIARAYGRLTVPLWQGVETSFTRRGYRWQ